MILSVFEWQLQEKVVESYELPLGVVTVEQQPNSLLTVEFAGSGCRELMLMFMGSKPGLLDYKKPFSMQLREFQSKMGISAHEQKALNALTFREASIYANYQTSLAFTDRLH